MTRTTLRVLLWLASALAMAAWLMLAWRTLAGAGGADPFEVSVLERAAQFAKLPAPYADSHAAGSPLLPVFPLCVSWLVRLFDAGAWEPRLVSLLATLVTAIVAGFVVRDETQSLTLGATATGLLLMSQGAATGQAVLGRPEPLMLLLAILGCVALREGRGIPGALLGSLLLGVACLTDPGGIWFTLAVLFHLGVHDRRRLLAFALGLAAVACGAVFGLPRWLGPGFDWTAWNAAVQALRFAPAALLQFVGTQLLGTLGVFTLATVLTFALPVRPWRGAVGIWTWMAFAGLAAGLVASQAGGDPGGALRLAGVTLAIVGPLSALRVTQHLSNWPGGSRMGGQAVVLTALALQFVTLLASAAQNGR